MDFIAFLGVLRRHWIVVVVALAITAGAALGATRLVKPDYSASASALLLAPQAEDPTNEDATPCNKLICSGSLDLAATFMVESFSDPKFQAELKAKGASEDWSVGAGDNGILGVQVTGSDAAATQRTLGVVLRELRTQLRTWQLDRLGVEPSQLITDTVLRKTDVPEAQTGSRVRALAAVAALGIITAIALAFVLEAIARNRKSKQQLSRRSGDDDARSELADPRFADARPFDDEPVVWPIESDEPAVGTRRS